MAAAQNAFAHRPRCFCSGGLALLLLVLTMGLLRSCRSEVFVVGGGPDGWKITNTFPDLQAVVGDVLTFEYSTPHTVVSPKEKTCDFEGKTDLAGVGDSPFNLTLSEPGTMHIACDIPGHCPAGMLFTVVVDSAETGAASGKGGGGKESKKVGRKDKRAKRKPRKGRKEGVPEERSGKGKGGKDNMEEDKKKKGKKDAGGG